MNDLDGVGVPDVVGSVRRLQFGERVVAAAEVDQRGGRRTFAELDDAAEHDDVVPNVDLAFDPAANGR